MVASEDNVGSEVAELCNGLFKSEVVRSLCPVNVSERYFPIQLQLWHKIMSKGKDKDVGEGKSEKPKSHQTVTNKKLYLDLVFEEKLKGNRPGKGFNAIGWENIVKTFNEKTGM